MQECSETSGGNVSKTVLLSTFVIKKKVCRVYFHCGTLIWETQRAPCKRWRLSLTDVLAAHYGDGWVPGIPVKENKLSAPSSSASSPMPVTSPTSFVLHYAARGSRNRWTHHSVTMSHKDPRQVASWVKTIRNYLEGLSHRPKKILMFINPFGGKRKALKIWEKKIQPVMAIAGVETKLMVTDRAGHICETLLTTNLDDVQAVVCIGGDGTFSEVFNGLVLRTAKDRQIDLGNPEATLPTPRLPVGVIPGGSTDTVAYSLHGTTDVQTAAIHIIFGDTVGVDLSSVHTNGQPFMRLYASVLSYGYLGDVLRDSENFRWMGPQRYDYSGFKKIIANKGYEGEIGILSDPCHPYCCIRCLKDCERCDQHKPNDVPDKEFTRWTTVRGKFFMVNSANMSCACSRSPMGFSPHAHIGDGCVDVILVRHTSLFNNIRMLLRLSSKEKTVYDLPFVEVYRAREMTFRALPKSSQQRKQKQQSTGENNTSRYNSRLSVWNCDGEVIEDSNLKIRVHCQLLNVYTRRVVEPEEDLSCFCSL